MSGEAIQLRGNRGGAARRGLVAFVAAAAAGLLPQVATPAAAAERAADLVADKVETGVTLVVGARTEAEANAGREYFSDASCNALVSGANKFLGDLKYDRSVGGAGTSNAIVEKSLSDMKDQYVNTIAEHCTDEYLEKVKPILAEMVNIYEEETGKEYHNEYDDTNTTKNPKLSVVLQRVTSKGWKDITPDNKITPGKNLRVRAQGFIGRCTINILGGSKKIKSSKLYNAKKGTPKTYKYKVGKKDVGKKLSAKVICTSDGETTKKASNKTAKVIAKSKANTSTKSAEVPAATGEATSLYLSPPNDYSDPANVSTNTGNNPNLGSVLVFAGGELVEEGAKSAELVILRNE